MIVLYKKNFKLIFKLLRYCDRFGYKNNIYIISYINCKQ